MMYVHFNFPDETFRIDPNSGEITVNNNVDREVYSSFDLIVEVCAMILWPYGIHPQVHMCTHYHRNIFTHTHTHAHTHGHAHTQA